MMEPVIAVSSPAVANDNDAESVVGFGWGGCWLRTTTAVGARGGIVQADIPLIKDVIWGGGHSPSTGHRSAKKSQK